MYKWRIKFYMKNGSVFEGFYRGPEMTSGDVANKVCTGISDNFTGIFGEDERHNLFVKIGEIQAYVISPY